MLAQTCQTASGARAKDRRLAEGTQVNTQVVSKGCRQGGWMHVVIVVGVWMCCQGASSRRRPAATETKWQCNKLQGPGYGASASHLVRESCISNSACITHTYGIRFIHNQSTMYMVKMCRDSEVYSQLTHACCCTNTCVEHHVVAHYSTKFYCINMNIPCSAVKTSVHQLYAPCQAHRCTKMFGDCCHVCHKDHKTSRHDWIWFDPVL